MEWKKQIAIAYLVQQELKRADVEGLWSYNLPNKAATEEQLADAELTLGEPLDQSYREFLKCANGWYGVLQAIDLFGTVELRGGELMNRAYQLLKSIDDLHTMCGVTFREIFPIAVSPDSADVFIMTRRSSSKPGRVLWLANSLIDSWPNFAEFFLAVIDYNRNEMANFSRLKRNDG